MRARELLAALQELPEHQLDCTVKATVSDYDGVDITGLRCAYGYVEVAVDQDQLNEAFL